MTTWSVVRVSLGVLAIACLLVVGYDWIVWGYFGLNFGEANYDDRGLYWLMLIGGGAAIALGVTVGVVWIVRTRGRRHPRAKERSS